MKNYTLPTMYDEIPIRDRKLVREQYVKEQRGICIFCKSELSRKPPEGITSKRIDWDLFPPFFLKYPIHLQHCHTTGLTEGAVHAYCNAVMWQYHGR